MTAFCATLIMAQVKISSPDKTLYAVEEDGQNAGQAEERERFSVFDINDKPVSVLHIWLREPNGTYRVGIRGCETSGWIDSARFYCEGTINPSTGVYLWFDARSGQEPGEAIGAEFTWSPDHTKLAQFGNVPHFSEVEEESDSLVVGAYEWPPSSIPEQHWFRSDLSWSPDSKYVAVVDHQRRINKAFFLEVLNCSTNERAEMKLNWPDEADDWYPPHDFSVEWTRDQVIVRRADVSQGFPRN